MPFGLSAGYDLKNLWTALKDTTNDTFSSDSDEMKRAKNDIRASLRAQRALAAKQKDMNRAARFRRMGRRGLKYNDKLNPIPAMDKDERARRVKLVKERDARVLNAKRRAYINRLFTHEDTSKRGKAPARLRRPPPPVAARKRTPSRPAAPVARAKATSPSHSLTSNEIRGFYGAGGMSHGKPATGKKTTKPTASPGYSRFGGMSMATQAELDAIGSKKPKAATHKPAARRSKPAARVRHAARHAFKRHAAKSQWNEPVTRRELLESRIKDTLATTKVPDVKLKRPALLTGKTPVAAGESLGHKRSTK